MATYTKHILSASTNGKGILVTGTGTTAPTTIHATPAGTTSVDEIFLYAFNSGSAANTVSIGWGGTLFPNDSIAVILQAGLGRLLVADGRLLQNGNSIVAFSQVASGTNSVVMDGFVNRITA